MYVMTGGDYPPVCYAYIAWASAEAMPGHSVHDELNAFRMVHVVTLGFSGPGKVRGGGVNGDERGSALARIGDRRGANCLCVTPSLCVAFRRMTDSTQYMVCCDARVPVPCPYI